MIMGKKGEYVRSKLVYIIMALIIILTSISFYKVIAREIILYTQGEIISFFSFVYYL